eukprot:TRINITY_DN15846_c0_g1_i2.p1 TRINITY_DN15846_c0_g1~~TRINITY_DN15846_c0_g1_i2.p1  ORF type:complete len:385 (-),score=83.31 TRINITY_DN15846_c0_g1_i2:27-1181(-)
MASGRPPDRAHFFFERRLCGQQRLLAFLHFFALFVVDSGGSSFDGSSASRGSAPRSFTASDFAAGNWRNGSVGREQQAFIDQVKRIMDLFKIEVWYDMYEGGFLWDHLMPMFHVLPGKLVFPRDSDINQELQGLGAQQRAALERRGFDPEQDVTLGGTQAMHWHVESGRRHIVLSMSPPARWDLRSTTDQFFELSHGVDEDHFWRLEGHKAEHAAWSPSLLFSKYAHEHCRRGTEPLKAKLKPSRLTVLYLASKANHCNDACFFSGPSFDNCSPKNPNPHIWTFLQRMSRRHNVIIRPHPRDLDGADGGYKRIRRTFPHCLISEYKDGYDVRALARLADVILAEPSGVSSAVLAEAPGTAFVYLLRERSDACERQAAVGGRRMA